MQAICAEGTSTARTDPSMTRSVKDRPSPAREILHGIVLVLLISALCIAMAFGISSVETGSENSSIVPQSFYE
jgi:hypothetical protein